MMLRLCRYKLYIVVDDAIKKMTVGFVHLEADVKIKTSKVGLGVLQIKETEEKRPE